MSPSPPVAENPYAAPQSVVHGTVRSEVLRAREALLSREASLRGLGAVFAFVAAPCLALLLMVPGLLGVIGTESGEDLLGSLLACAVGLGGTWTAARLGRRLLRLEAVSAVEFVVVTGFSLLAFPLGPLVMGVTAALVGSSAGRRVLSAEGAELREQSAGVVAPWRRTAVVAAGGAVLLTVVQPLLFIAGLVWLV